MVKSMVQRKVPIDGVGLQMHVSMGEAAPDEAKVSANITRLGKLGLKVHITEMDVKCPDPCNAAGEQAQAEVYASMLRACLANPGVCTSFESWGFTDAVTWLTGVRCIRPTGKTKCHRETFFPLGHLRSLRPDRLPARSVAVRRAVSAEARGGRDAARAAAARRQEGGPRAGALTKCSMEVQNKRRRGC